MPLSINTTNLGRGRTPCSIKSLAETLHSVTEVQFNQSNYKFHCYSNIETNYPKQYISHYEPAWVDISNP